AGLPRKVPMKPTSFRDLEHRLRAAGLRLTKSRSTLGNLLFAKGTRHVTAEMLFEEAKQANVFISLATVYNTLREFSEAGILRPLKLDGTKSYYDTNVSNHQHFCLEDGSELIDTPAKIRLKKLPAPPEGYAIDRVDVVIRLRRTRKPATFERSMSIQ